MFDGKWATEQRDQMIWGSPGVLAAIWQPAWSEQLIQPGADIKPQPVSASLL